MTTEHKASGPSVSFALKPEKLTDDAVQTVKDAATEWEEKGVITRIDWDALSMTATNQLNNCKLLSRTPHMINSHWSSHR